MTATTESTTAHNWEGDVYDGTATLHLTPTDRIRVHLDESPVAPYNYAAFPVFTLEFRTYRWAASESGHGEEAANLDGLGTDPGEALSDLAHKYGLDMAERIVRRWLRVFHGGDLVRTESAHRGDNCTYYAYSTAFMLDALGIEPGTSPNFGEYMDYVNGDVYYATRETWESACECTDCGAGEWVEVDSIGGLYGEDYAREGALEHLA